MGGLRRAIGPVGAILLTVGAMIGSGIFVALGPATASAGSGLLAAIGVAGLVALMNGLSSSQLGINFPVSGGTYTFARKVGVPTMGFIAGAAFLGKEVVGLSVIAITFATYSAQLLPGLPVELVAAVTVMAVTTLNYVGVEPTGKVIMGLTVAKVALLLGFVAYVLPDTDQSALSPPLGDSPVGTMAGAAVFFFAYAGYARIATIAEEIDNPRRTIPFGITVGFVLAALVFFGVGFVTLGSLGVEATADSNTPVFDAAEQLGGQWLSTIVVIAAWLATLSVLVGGVLGVSRVGMAMGREGDLPSWLEAVHDRFRTPHRAVSLLGVLIAMLAVLGGLRALLEIASVLTLLYYVVTNLAALRLTRHQRTLPRFVSGVGLLGCLALLASLPSQALLIGALIVVGLGAVRLLVSRRSGSPADGENMGR